MYSLTRFDCIYVCTYVCVCTTTDILSYVSIEYLRMVKLTKNASIKEERKRVVSSEHEKKK